jgi:hypothetical protein
MSSYQTRSINRWAKYLDEQGMTGLIESTNHGILRWEPANGEWVGTVPCLTQFGRRRYEVFRLTEHGLGNKWNSQLVHPDASPDAYAKLVETIFLQEVLREDD